MDLWKLNRNNPEAEKLLNTELKLHTKQLKTIEKKQKKQFKSSPTFKLQQMLCLKHKREITKLNKRIRKIKLN